MFESMKMNVSLLKKRWFHAGICIAQMDTLAIELELLSDVPFARPWNTGSTFARLEIPSTGRYAITGPCGDHRIGAGSVLPFPPRTTGHTY